jgi:hypothetical protein
MAGRRCNRVNKNKQGHAMRRVSRTPFVHQFRSYGDDDLMISAGANFALVALNPFYC